MVWPMGRNTVLPEHDPQIDEPELLKNYFVSGVADRVVVSREVTVQGTC